MHPRAIHQFHTSATYGDGVTNGMFFIQRILQASAYTSNIYCIDIDHRLSSRVLPHTNLDDNPEDILLVHYSLGSDKDHYVTNLRLPRIIVYHNITPAHFFWAGSTLKYLSETGRRQLARWARAGTFMGAIGVSAFNGEELTQIGYPSVANIELLVDLERICGHAWNRAITAEITGARNILFVGRVCEHKNQINLVHMMEHLSAISDVPVRLLLVGRSSSDRYEAEVLQAIDRLGSAAEVRLLGHRDDEDVYALYRMADLYVSASQHEGFGMPLVEAMAFDLPVLAYAAGGITAALGSGGLILNNAAPERLAAAAKMLLHEPRLRRAIIEGQRASLGRFERAALTGAFEQYLRQLGFDVTFDKAERMVPARSKHWSVEGPFDSSYSLAIVNRELARALMRTNEAVALTSRDGPGLFDPQETFLEANPDLAGMVERGRRRTSPDVCMRNQFPPYVADMRGALRVLANFAWEESGFPIDWVRDFNASLDLVTVTSSYVAKVLRDNGVRCPICVVGNGIDQILAGDDYQRASEPAPHGDGTVFRFLHVSSGFPRKGLDVLLAAWGAAFTQGDKVELVIKTFPNIHNNVDAELEGFRARYPNGAPITLVNLDLSPEALRELYQNADALVCPSRGEGFGLPLAEAMALGRPVITTAYGGQSDYCTTETAWLCDYSFAYAKTHLGIFNSVWVEPDPESLTRMMRGVFEATIEERTKRSETGRQHVLSHYTWDSVSQRTRAAVAQVQSAPSAQVLRLPVIGLVSTWNSRCGIATYAQSLVSGIEPERLHVFATRMVEPLQPDEAFVRRCWVEGWDDPLDELFQEIHLANPDAVIIQFNFGFFRLAALQRLIERLHARGTLVFITLHSTMDVVTSAVTIRLTDIRQTLADVCRLLVHSVHDLNRLKAIGLIDNVTLFPHGLPEPFNGNRAAVRQSLGLESKTVIASFGFFLPQKGLRELIGATAALRARVPNIHLVMLNALYPVPASEAEVRACQEEISRLGMTGDVTLVTDFLSESDVIARLAAADVIVYPYQNTQESASGAVRIGLSSLTPVAVTPLPIFTDITEVSHILPGTTPADIANGLAQLLEQPDKVVDGSKQRAWVTAHAWPHLSARLDGMIRGELITAGKPQSPLASLNASPVKSADQAVAVLLCGG